MASRHESQAGRLTPGAGALPGAAAPLPDLGADVLVPRLAQPQQLAPAADRRRARDAAERARVSCGVPPLARRAPAAACSRGPASVAWCCRSRPAHACTILFKWQSPGLCTLTCVWGMRSNRSPLLEDGQMSTQNARGLHVVALGPSTSGIVVFRSAWYEGRQHDCIILNAELMKACLNNRTWQSTHLVGRIGQPARPQRERHGSAWRGALPLQQLPRAGRRVCDHTEGTLQAARIECHHLRGQQGWARID